MGLDMYLEAVKKVDEYSAKDYDEINNVIPSCGTDSPMIEIAPGMMKLNMDYEDTDIDLDKIKSIDLEKESGIPGANQMKDHIFIRGTPGVFTWSSIFKEMGYWRKCNAIHNWFVENVQGGVDECEPHIVTEDQIYELKNTVDDLIAKTRKLNGGKVPRTSNNVFAKSGKYRDIVIPEEAKQVLPSVEGFFFGGTEYDLDYYWELLVTKEQLDVLLGESGIDTKPFDFENEQLIYRASW